MTSLQDALDTAYRYLGYRDRTVAEVRSHLVDKKLIDEQVADAAIVELREQGYVDDARFARRFTEDRRELDAWGNERIGRRLATLGVPDDLIAAALETRTSSSELDAAVLLLRRKFSEPLDDARARQRALGVLVRKGYELELAYEAVRRCARSAPAVSQLG